MTQKTTTIYAMDDLETDLAWFDGIGVSEKEAKGIIKFLLERLMDTPVYEELKKC